MASWADEFDVDDSDIIGALHNKRKDISQLASPPWPPAAAPLSIPPSPPRSMHPPSSIAASESFLKRFQKPRLSPNEDHPTLDPSRKRKQGLDTSPSLPFKAAYRQRHTLNDAIDREDLGQLDGAICSNTHSQGEDVFVSATDEQCQSLSSHDVSPTAARRATSDGYLRNTNSRNTIRDEETMEPLKEKQHNLHLNDGKASFTPLLSRHNFKQSPAINKVQQKRISFAQAQEKEYNATSNQIPSAPQQEHGLVDVMDCDQPTAADPTLRMPAPSVRQRSVLNASSDKFPKDTSVHVESRGIRCLEKDLQYQIPGPAGTVQRGLGQKSKFSREDSSKRNNSVVHPASVTDDADFQSGSWLKGENYLEKSSISVSSISSIKTSRTVNRIPKLLAVIKTCTPNGCGDIMVNLKDHSDIINGTVNRRVMSETEFGRLIEPGAVILLHQVAVFSPTPYAHYLNITVNNVEQVFAKGVQFFKGECSRAATNAVVQDMSEREQLISQRRVVGETSARKTVYEVLEEDDDELEILLGPSRCVRATTKG